VTYADGYRAPDVTDVLNAGVHPPFFPGSPNGFTFLPNTSLRPEVGKTKEAGINFKFDDIAFAGDKFRGKINVYRNDVDDYIDLATFGPPILFCPVGPIPGCPPVPMVPLVPYSFTQYQNVANARLEGIEAETMYDAGAWFLGVSASHVRGTNRSNGQPLFNIPPDQIATTVGVRLLERKLTLSVRWAAVAAKKAGDIPDLDGDGLPDVPAMPSYNLVNLYVGYQPTEDILAGLSVENLFNRYYVRYPEVFPQAGITVKGSLKIRFGA
jgi:hemoglobin/transferrin/lactoferrin receptor protein